MDEVIQRLKGLIQNFNLFSGIALILIFAVVFFMVRAMVVNKASKLVWLYVFTTLLTGVYFFFNKNELSTVLFLIIQGMFALAIVALFATEIKRELWNKRSADTSSATGSADVDYCIDEIIKAVQNMSKSDIGAIIVLSNDNIAESTLKSGVSINAEISSQLIESIFLPKTPLHDGALIINGKRIQSAGCFLPVSQEINLSKDLGSRHRAGIGLTETVNVTAIIVSEETGIISIAKSGKIARYADTNALRTALKEYYWKDMI